MLLRYLNATLVCFPRELRPIVADYATEIPHIWNQYAPPQNSTDLLITGNEAACNQSGPYWTSSYNHYYVVSGQSIDDGPQRWRISINFTAGRFGRCWIGAAVSDYNRSADGSVRYGVGGADSDVFVETNVCPANQKGRRTYCRVFRHMKVDEPAVRLRQVRQATVDVSIDPVANTMLITDGDQFRLTVDLPPLSTAGTVWRPAVVVAGCVRAIILPSL